MKFDLRARLAELGAEPKRSLGQNFLVNTHVVTKIVQEALGKNASQLIEIGPGPGALTEALLAADLQPNLIELDSKFADYWRGRGLEVLEEDALKVDWNRWVDRPNTLLVSNLPYQIATHLVVERCLGPVNLKYMILMFQKEVAERLMAKPRTKEYGTLSVLAQTHFRLKKLADAAPKDFYPPPKVASRVLTFERLADPGLGSRFLTLLKAGFAFRRKFLLKNLKGVVDSATMQRLPEIWEELGFKAQCRAEELTPSEWVKLCQVVYERN
ncbi:MAG: 16S rRNA (adenine(1518)-N(6)/adenine(1519)-N(6))-dimethyltransferase RsmA [Bdellovibrionales bacterium]